MSSNIRNHLTIEFILASFSLFVWMKVLTNKFCSTSSARLGISARYSSGHEMREEFISLHLANLPGTGAGICNAVVSKLSNDGAPSMIGEDAGFVNLFTKLWSPIIWLSLYCSSAKYSGSKHFGTVLQRVY